MLNVYDELGIDPSEPTASIRERLARIKANDATRASRSDAAGEAARARISQIEELEASFTDDTTRRAYDQGLRAAPAVETASGPDWLQLAWAYYAQEDFGPAEVAARKAREADKDNPDVWVVSAWIALVPITRHPLMSDESWMSAKINARARNQSMSVELLVDSAKKFADEAYTPFGSSAAGDVAHVRGVCFYFLEEFPRAIQSYTSALEATEDPATLGELYLRIALAAEQEKDIDQVLVALENWIRVTQDLSDVTMLQRALQSWCMFSRSYWYLVENKSMAAAFRSLLARVITCGLSESATSLLRGFCEHNIEISVIEQEKDSDKEQGEVLWKSFYEEWNRLCTNLDDFSRAGHGGYNDYTSLGSKPLSSYSTWLRPSESYNKGCGTLIREFEDPLREVKDASGSRPFFNGSGQRDKWDKAHQEYGSAQAILKAVSTFSQPALSAYDDYAKWSEQSKVRNTKRDERLLELRKLIEPLSDSGPR